MARKSKKAQEAAAALRETGRRASALVVRMRAAGVVSKVRARYDGSQGNADTDAPEGSEAYEWAQHDYAIENVFNMLAETNLLVEGDDERVVSFAYADVS